MYIYKADVWCDQCATQIIEDLGGAPPIPADSDDVPVYAGDELTSESDAPYSCYGCRVLLGNPLTPEGVAALCERLREYAGVTAAHYDVESVADTVAAYQDVLPMSVVAEWRASADGTVPERRVDSAPVSFVVVVLECPTEDLGGQELFAVFNADQLRRVLAGVAGTLQCLAAALDSDALDVSVCTTAAGEFGPALLECARFYDRSVDVTSHVLGRPWDVDFDALCDDIDDMARAGYVVVHVHRLPEVLRAPTQTPTRFQALHVHADLEMVHGQPSPMLSFSANVTEPGSRNFYTQRGSIPLYSMIDAMTTLPDMRVVDMFDSLTPHHTVEIGWKHIIRVVDLGDHAV